VMFRDLFCGAFYLVLKAENNGKYSDDSYFVYSALIAVAFFEWLFLFALSMLAGDQYFSLYENPWFGFLIIVLISGINWFRYIKNKKYKIILKTSIKSAVLKKMYVFLGATVSVFFIAVLYKMLLISST